MATGRVLQFDQARGFGFITAEDGGDDVFLHASVFNGNPGDLIPGMKVEFEIMAGDRGRKAFAVHAVNGAPVLADNLGQTAQPPPGPEDEQMCDVLSHAEFTHEVTEVLLSGTPTLTSRQILEVRQSMLEFARKRGWVDV